MIATAGRLPVSYLVLDFCDVPTSDSSAISAIAKLHRYFDRNGCLLILTRMNVAIESQFKRAGLHPDSTNIVFYADLDMALEYYKEKLLAADANPELPVDFSIWDRIRKGLPAGTPLFAFMTYLQPRSFKPDEYLVK
jgi:anti-anti-sigma regulatory factor